MTKAMMHSGEAAARRYLKAYDALRGSKHRLKQCLGTGSFGAVFAVSDARSTMAMKIIDPAAAGPEEVHERCMLAEREIAVMQALHGKPHIMPLLDSACLHMPTGKVYLLFMPVLTTLEAHLRNMKGVLNLDQLAADIAAALSSLARAGIIHRDICIKNIFLDEKGRFVLGDFGVAVSAVERAPNEFGHRGYIPPDHYVSPASDIYCLGAVLFYVASGSGALLRDGIVPDITGVSPRMMRVIRRCLEMRPEDRFQNSAELLKALRPDRGETIKVNVPLLSVKELYRDGNLTEALRLARENAQDTEIRPLLHLLTYLNGVKQGDEAGGYAAWKTLADDSNIDGNAKLLFVNGWVHLAHDPDDPAGFLMLVESAETGFAPAMYYIGHAYYYDRNDRERGLERFHRSARAGYYDALRVLERLGEQDEEERVLLDAMRGLPKNKRRRKSFADFL